MASFTSVIWVRDTAKIAASIQEFNPSDDWLRVE